MEICESRANRTVNLNGGVLRPYGTNALFSGTAGQIGAITVNVLAGGAVVDTSLVPAVAWSPLLSGTANDGGLTMTGSNTLTLLGANTYTGPTAIAAGALQVGSGGTTGSISTSSGVSVAAGATLILNRTDSYGGSWSLPVSGSGNLQLSNGTLTVIGNLAYTGSTTNNNGILQLGDGTPGHDGLLSTSALVNNNLQVHFNYYGNQTVAYPISGNGTLWQQGPGTLTLTGSDSAGFFSIISGTLQIGDGTPGHDGSLNVAGGNPISNNSALIYNTAVSQTGTSVISGVGTLTKTGPGTLTLSGSNSFSGDTRILSGTLQLANASALAGSALNYLNSDSGTLNFGSLTAATFGGLKGDKALVLTNTSGAAVTLDVAPAASGTVTYTGAITGSNSVLRFDGPGTQRLDPGATNTITVSSLQLTGGGATLESGTLQALIGLSYAVQIQGGTFTQNGGTVTTGTTWTKFGIYGGGSWVLNSGTISNTTSGYSYVGGSDVGSGAGALIVNGGLAQLSVLAVGHSGSGTITLNGGILQASPYWDQSGTASRTVNLNGGTLKPYGTAALFSGSTGQIGALSVNVLAGGAIVDTSLGSAVAWSPFLSGVINDGGLTKTGSNTLTLLGANTYTGNTTINSGTLQLGDGTTGHDPTLATGGIIDNATLAIDVAGNQNPAWLITGTGSLAKSGPGTLTLAGSNSYTGATTISSGTLSVSSLANGGIASNIGASTNASANLVFDGGTLQYTGSSQSVDRGFTINSAKTATINVSAANATLSFSGTSPVTTGALTKNGAGTLSLSGSQGYTGATTINGGILQLNAANILAAAGSLVVNSGTLDLGGSIQSVNSLSLSPGGRAQNGTINLIGVSPSVTITGGNITPGIVLSASSSSGNVKLLGTGTLSLASTSTCAGISGFEIETSVIVGPGGKLYDTTANGCYIGTSIPNSSLTVTGSNALFDGGGTSIQLANGGILTVANGATVTNVAQVAGFLANSSGAITVNGGTLSTSAFQPSSNSLPAIVGGGTQTSLWSVSPNSVSLGYATSGSAVGSTLTVDSNGLMTVAGAPFGFAVGFSQLTGSNSYSSASNSLTVRNGGQISIAANGLTVGKLASGTAALYNNSAVVTGPGSQLTIAAGGVTVGMNYGYGNTLTVDNGGLVETTAIIVGGATSASNNTIAVQTGTGASRGILQFTVASPTVTINNAAAGNAVNFNNATLSYRGVTSGSAKLTDNQGATGVGLFTWSGINAFRLNSSIAYTGTSNYTFANNLGATNYAALEMVSGTTALKSGTVTIDGANGGSLLFRDTQASFDQNVILSGTVNVTEDGQTGSRMNSTFAGTGALNKIGGGSLGLSASNGFTGATTVTSGTLLLRNQNALANSSVIAPQTGVLAFDSSVTGHAFNFGGLAGAGNLALQDNAAIPNAIALTVGANNQSATYSGTLSGAGALIKTGTGIQFLSGSNTHAGGTTVSNGTLQVGNANALGTGGLTVNGGTFDLAGNSVSVPAFSGAGGSVTNSVSGTSTLTANTSGTSTYNGNIADGPGSVVLTNSGAGTLILGGSLTMTGLNASNGVTQLTQSGSIGAVNVAAGATVVLAANSGGMRNVLNVSSLTISGFTSTLANANIAAVNRAAYTPVALSAQIPNAGVLTDTGRVLAQAATTTSAIEPASPEAVPEPGALGLLLLGAMGLLGRRARKKSFQGK